MAMMLGGGSVTTPEPRRANACYTRSRCSIGISTQRPGSRPGRGAEGGLKSVSSLCLRSGYQWYTEGSGYNCASCSYFTIMVSKCLNSLPFQEERFLLRHMEREEPQGEENGDPNNPHSLHLQQQLASKMSSMDQAMAVQHQRLQLLLAASSAVQQQQQQQPPSTTRQATPTATPTYTQQRAILEAAAVGAPPPPHSPRPMQMMQDELWASKLAAAAAAAGGGRMSADKLNPSVYSHPNAQDPVLMTPKNYFPVLGGKRANVDITSSGAFFDPKAVNRSKDAAAANRPSSDIITQLTRELKLQQQNLLSSSDISSSSPMGSGSQLNIAVTTNATSAPVPASAATTTTTSTAAAAAAKAGMVVTSRTSSSSGYKSDNSISSESQHQQQQQHQQQHKQQERGRNPHRGGEHHNPSNTLSVGRAKKTPDKLTLLSRSQPDIYSELSAGEELDEGQLQQQAKSPTNGVSSGSVPSLPANISANQIKVRVYRNSPLPLADPPHLFSSTASRKDDLLCELAFYKAPPFFLLPLSCFVLCPVWTAFNVFHFLQVIEALQKENQELRTELEELSKKVAKVSLLEQEMSKIHQAYQNLLKHSEKRENLEKAARQKLQNVIINLTEVNKVWPKAPLKKDVFVPEVCPCCVGGD